MQKIAQGRAPPEILPRATNCLGPVLKIKSKEISNLLPVVHQDHHGDHKPVFCCLTTFLMRQADKKTDLKVNLIRHILKSSSFEKNLALRCKSLLFTSISFDNTLMNNLYKCKICKNKNCLQIFKLFWQNKSWYITL